MRVAAIDCGTNSIRLLVADVEQVGESVALRDVVRRMEIARLGQGVDRTGELAPDALARTFAVIEDYAIACALHGVEKVRVVATSATRDASNRTEFVEGVRERIGAIPEVISGLEEASLGFRGAASAASGQPEPALMVDIGGGSTELVLGTAFDGTVLAQYSMDVGSVRMRERHFRHDPPTDREIADARRDVADHIEKAMTVVPIGQARTLIGTAGTITTLTAEILGLNAYDPLKVDGTVLTFAQMEKAADWFLRAGADQRAGRGYMHPGRVDVIAAGSLVFSEILRHVERETAQHGEALSELVTSEHDILDGIALALV